MGRVAVLATCALNQWALDYQGNMERIIESIRRAKTAGATYLCGTELNIVGYGCGDHYHESDTEMHAWEVLAAVLQHADCLDIMVDVGLPIMHKNVYYNCKLVFLNKNVLFIRPKMILANDGYMGYGETRWFTEWTKVREIEDYMLPQVIRKVSGQTTVPFGDGVIVTRDTTIGYEICEELWNPESCHIAQCLDGAEIISNGLGSLEEFGRPGIGYQMVQMATAKSGGCYLLANQKGCDGGIGYYPGDACIGLNGNIIAHATLYTIEEVEVVTACVDLESIRHYKASIRSRCLHAARSKSFPKIEVDFLIATDEWWGTGIPLNSHKDPVIPTMEEQILKAPACWLWDFLRRSGRKGFLLPLSGDIDSSATAAIVFSMCHLVMNAITTGNEKVLANVRDVIGEPHYIPSDAQGLFYHLVLTLCVGTASSPQENVFGIVNELAFQIGSNHLLMNLTENVSAIENKLSKFLIQRSTNEQIKENASQEDTAMERFRMRIAKAVIYFLAETTKDPGEHSRDLIVLGSCNSDNKLMRINVQNDKTSLDLNLIGRFSKKNLIKFLQMAKDRLKLPVLEKVLFNAANVKDEELLRKNEDFSIFLNLQAVERCGPFSMFGRMWHIGMMDTVTPHEVAEKVKSFFRLYNFHWQKTVVSPTAFYMPTTGPPKDSRPLFYPQAWSWQFLAIDKAVKKIESEGEKNKT